MASSLASTDNRSPSSSCSSLADSGSSRRFRASPLARLRLGTDAASNTAPPVPTRKQPHGQQERSALQSAVPTVRMPPKRLRPPACGGCASRPPSATHWPKCATSRSPSKIRPRSGQGQAHGQKQALIPLPGRVRQAPIAPAEQVHVAASRAGCISAASRSWVSPSRSATRRTASARSTDAGASRSTAAARW